MIDLSKKYRTGNPYLSLTRRSRRAYASMAHFFGDTSFSMSRKKSRERRQQLRTARNKRVAKDRTKAKRVRKQKQCNRRNKR